MVDLFSKKTINYLLKKYKAEPSRGLGQNFLIDKGVIRIIASAAQLSPEDTVLEIGPGLGSLTQELARRVKAVISVEKDGRMVDVLKETLQDFKNTKIIQGDILNIKLAREVIPSRYKVVANLPFYITAPVIRHFLEMVNIESRPVEMILMTQKEVAQRICSKPPKMNLLAVSVQFYAKPEIISYISKKSFWPQPKVDAAIIKITPLIATDNKSTDADLFFKIVKAGFSHPRKQIGNNLSKELELTKEQISIWLSKNNTQPSQRAENLNIKDWINLAQNYPR